MPARTARGTKAAAVAAPADALAQIELITGSANTPIRIRAVKDNGNAIEFEGSLATIGERARKLNIDGHNIYFVAQPTRPIAEGASAKNDDVTGVRCLYADGDTSELPAHWHEPPTFTLVHPRTKRWWAFWTIKDVSFTVADLPDVIKRIAARYASDPKVCNPARVVRLAGFDRWKDGESFGPYALHRGKIGATQQWMHQNLPKLAPRKAYEGKPNSDDVIAVQRLRALLALIEPVERQHWLSVMFAIRDGKVIDEGFAELDEADKLAIFDEWASGELNAKATSPRLPHCHVGNYQGYEDNAYHWSVPRSKHGQPVTFGSIVHLAKAHAAKQGVKVSEVLCRPGVPELAQRFGFKPITAVAGGAVPANDNPGDALVRSAEAHERSYFRFLDSDELDALKPPAWIVPDLLSEDANALLVGPPRSFKTFIALDIAMSIATGVSGAVCSNVKKTGPVLFAVGEGYGNIGKRVRAWTRTYLKDGKASNLVVVNPVPPVADEVRWVEFIAKAKAKRLGGYALVVLDTVGRSMQGLNENAQEDASKFTKLVDMLRRELGATVLGLHHSGHEASGRARGSSVFGADADTILSLTRTGKDYSVSLDMAKQKDAAEWEEPKPVALKEVRLFPDDKSLVAVKPEAVETTTTSPPHGRAKHHPHRDHATTAILDKAVAEELQANPTRTWTTNDLAETVAMREEIAFKSTSLKRRMLKDLRETKGTNANRCYEARLKRWRWKK